MCKALGSCAAARGTVRRLFPPVVPGVEVPSKLYQHLHQIGIFHLGSVVEGSLMKFGGIHVGTWLTNRKK